MDRLTQLAAWSLSPHLLAMARNELPHPAFDTVCQPIKFNQRNEFLGVRLEEVQAIGPSGVRPAVAMWENDCFDGHAFDILYCERAGSEVEFWNVQYADDMEEPNAELVARSEQGLFFWLFFSLIPAEYFRQITHQDAFDALKAAADAVGFRYFYEVMKFEEEFGSDENARRLICERSLMINDEP